MNPTAQKIAEAIALLILMTLPASAHGNPAVSANAVLSGRVVYANGRPASGVHVIAQIQDGAEMIWLQKQPHATWSRLLRTVEGAEAVTGPDGLFRLHVAPRLPYNIMVNLAKPPLEDDRNALWVTAAKAGVIGRPSQTTHLAAFVLCKGIFVSGLVTDRTTGGPLSGVHVGVSGPSRPDTSAMVSDTVTDTTGHYRLRVLPGKNEVYMSDGRYRSLPSRMLKSDGFLKTIQAAKGQCPQVNFQVMLLQGPSVPPL